MNAAMVLLKSAVIVVVIAAGVFFIQPANWHPFIPANAGHFGEFGWSA